MATFIRRALVARNLCAPFFAKTTNVSYFAAQKRFPHSNVNNKLSSTLVCCSSRPLSTSPPLWRADEGEEEKEDGEEAAEDEKMYKIVDVDTSIRYMKSEAYQTTYRGALVWVPYRRNHKGQLPPRKTRKTCIRKGVLSTGNPCPICRDEYLVVHPKNVDLLKQFINPNTGELLSYEKTGVCQLQHKNLMIAMFKAWDLGLIDKPLTFRKYDYSEYYPELLQAKAS